MKKEVVAAVLRANPDFGTPHVVRCDWCHETRILFRDENEAPFKLTTHGWLCETCNVRAVSPEVRFWGGALQDCGRKLRNSTDNRIAAFDMNITKRAPLVEVESDGVHPLQGRPSPELAIAAHGGLDPERRHSRHSGPVVLPLHISAEVANA